MGNGNYTPFEHLDAKGMWDESIASRGVTAETWIHNAKTVVGMWWIEGWLNGVDFINAIAELNDLCVAAGLDRNCIHCSSRSTKHNCLDCSNKGESKEA